MDNFNLSINKDGEYNDRSVSTYDSTTQSSDKTADTYSKVVQSVALSSSVEG